MAKIWIDGDCYEADEKQNLLAVCLSLGLNVPYFCWHPALGSVGACRQCAVKQFKDENDTEGKIVMACMTPAKDGTRVAIHDPEVAEFHASVIEWLMANHPHDCPICDEGGECHLQDMTVLTGHTYREYRFPKRTYRNQYLGPFINHEMNRCIQCYRCVRFYREYAGGRDLDVFGLHDDVYFGRHEDGTLESEFSGNLVEVCPTGVFTDKSLKSHYTRKWDLQTAPSICVHCSVGCNIIPGERYGTLRRVRSRYNSEVNGYFICDRGRYGYDFVNHERRLRYALRPRGTKEPAERLDRREALTRFAELVGSGRRVLGIGSPRASLESNYALQTLVGKEHFSSGMPAAEQRLVGTALDALRRGPSRTPSLREVEHGDAILILGEDVPNTAPRLALSIRQAAHNKSAKKAEKLGVPAWHDAAVRDALRHEKGPLFVLTPMATQLDALAQRTHRASAEDIARIGYAVAHALDERAPDVEGLTDDERALVDEIATALREAEKPLIVSGTACDSEPLVRAAAQAAWACGAVQGKQPAPLAYALAECNTLGTALLGGMDVDEALARLRDQRYDTVVVMENDLDRRLPADEVNALFDAAADVVILDYLAGDIAAGADLVLPAATFAEAHGTLVNHEGRAQRFYQVFAPSDGDIQESWAWLRDVDHETGHNALREWRTIDDIVTALAEGLPAFKDLPSAAPPATYRVNDAPVPRELMRYSGRTAMHAAATMHEPKPPADPDSPLAFSMEGVRIPLPQLPQVPQLAPEFWSPHWNSVQALTRFQEEINGPLRGGDPGVRLIEPTEDARPAYADDIPARLESNNNAWRVVGLSYTFGSDELSMLSGGIADRAPKMHVAIHPQDAQRLGAQPGQRVRVSFNHTHGEWPAEMRDDLPRGTVGLPVGLPEGISGPLPHWCEIERAQ